MRAARLVPSFFLFLLLPRAGLSQEAAQIAPRGTWFCARAASLERLDAVERAVNRLRPWKKNPILTLGALLGKVHTLEGVDRKKPLFLFRALPGRRRAPDAWFGLPVSGKEAFQKGLKIPARPAWAGSYALVPAKPGPVPPFPGVGEPALGALPSGDLVLRVLVRKGLKGNPYISARMIDGGMMLLTFLGGFEAKSFTGSAAFLAGLEYTLHRIERLDLSFSLGENNAGTLSFHVSPRKKSSFGPFLRGLGPDEGDLPLPGRPLAWHVWGGRPSAGPPLALWLSWKGAKALWDSPYRKTDFPRLFSNRLLLALYGEASGRPGLLLAKHVKRPKSLPPSLSDKNRFRDLLAFLGGSLTHSFLRFGSLGDVDITKFKRVREEREKKLLDYLGTMEFHPEEFKVKDTAVASFSLDLGRMPPSLQRLLSDPAAVFRRFAKDGILQGWAAFSHGSLLLYLGSREGAENLFREAIEKPGHLPPFARRKLWAGSWGLGETISLFFSPRGKTREKKPSAAPLPPGEIRFSLGPEGDGLGGRATAPLSELEKVLPALQRALTSKERER